jgi:AraC-like DNA-binding protein
MAAYPRSSFASGRTVSDGVWHYSRPIGGSAVELGTVRGLEVALPTHFHHEDQMTFVLSGRRRFIIGNELVDIGPDEGAYIPAGVAHRSLAESSQLFCINIYTPPGECSPRDLISDLARWRRRQGRLMGSDLAGIVEQHRGSPRQSPQPSPREAWRSVSEAAQLSGMSREGFSRRFRRVHGVPPQQFQLLERLNDARRLLRVGTPIAEAAAETGFADQSHLGRLFRRVFGITPGRYRAG